MELLILDALNWRMRSITPFSFLCFFLPLFELKDPPLIQALRNRAVELIFRAHNGTKTGHSLAFGLSVWNRWLKHVFCYVDVKFLEFKPSIISATALLWSSHELFPLQFTCFKDSISSCEHVNSVSHIILLITLTSINITRIRIKWHIYLHVYCRRTC